MYSYNACACCTDDLVQYADDENEADISDYSQDDGKQEAIEVSNRKFLTAVLMLL
jgi:hypothetical protein